MLIFATKKLSTGASGHKEDAASFFCPRSATDHQSSHGRGAAQSGGWAVGAGQSRNARAVTSLSYSSDSKPQQVQAPGETAAGDSPGEPELHEKKTSSSSPDVTDLHRTVLPDALNVGKLANDNSKSTYVSKNRSAAIPKPCTNYCQIHNDDVC